MTTPEDQRGIPPALPEDGLYPIRTVAAETGVNPVTLRAWERRYNLLEPRRTPKGHRLYTREQIDTIRRVVELLDRGIAISQVKPLLAPGQGSDAPGESAAPAPAQDIWGPLVKDLLSAVAAFDDDTLDRLYGEVMSLYPVDTVTSKLTIPVMEALGARWKAESAGIAEEHFLNAYLRNRLGARFHHLSKDRQGPRLVAACLPGEQHETGLLLFCLSAAARGYGIIYLGANMPLEELPEVAERTGAVAVILSATARPRPALLNEQLPDLVQLLRVPLFVGGRATCRHEKQIVAAGAVSVGTEIPDAIRMIEERTPR